MVPGKHCPSVGIIPAEAMSGQWLIVAPDAEEAAYNAERGIMPLRWVDLQLQRQQDVHLEESLGIWPHCVGALVQVATETQEIEHGARTIGNNIVARDQYKRELKLKLELGAGELLHSTATGLSRDLQFLFIMVRLRIACRNQTSLMVVLVAGKGTTRHIVDKWRGLWLEHRPHH